MLCWGKKLLGLTAPMAQLIDLIAANRRLALTPSLPGLCRFSLPESIARVTVLEPSVASATNPSVRPSVPSATQSVCP
ncbi:hypothetical protein SAY87_021233 [Trapa incisa]|uniref:Uncharacterized protein n=1 Tax=Trapa incisa TaxID=236973 RepID=A0AAN7PVL9_9MYRT|nr:hypothetical protein SAY87_021233 [Trapa incisa]